MPGRLTGIFTLCPAESRLPPLGDPSLSPDHRDSHTVSDIVVMIVIIKKHIIVSNNSKYKTRKAAPVSEIRPASVASWPAPPPSLKHSGRSVTRPRHLHLKETHPTEVLANNDMINDVANGTF